MNTKFLIPLLIPLFLLLVSCNKALTIEEQLQIAEVDIVNKDYQTAIIKLKNILKLHPSNNDARFLLATSHYQLGSFLSAEKEFIRLKEQGINLNLYVENLLSSLFGLEDTRGIIEFWESYKDDITLENKATVAPLISLAYIQAKELTKSHEIASDGLKWANETKNERLINTNSSFLNTFDTPPNHLSVINELNNTCKTYPDNWIICNLLANALFTSHDYIQAAETLQKVLELKPNHNMLLIKLADSYVLAENYEKAQKYTIPLLKLFPNQPYVNQLESVIQFNFKNYSKALNLINTTISHGYNSPKTKLIAASIHYKLKNYEQAIYHLKWLIEKFPEDPLITQLFITTKLLLGDGQSLISELPSKSYTEQTADLLASASIDLYKSGNNKLSLDILDKIKMADLNDPSTISNVALAKVIVSEQNEILGLNKMLNEIIDSDSTLENKSKSKVVLISSLITRDKIDDAIIQVNNWINEEPKNIVNYHLLIEVKKNEAPVDIIGLEAALNKILNIDKYDVLANMHFGKKHLINKKFQNAKSHFSNILKTNTNNLEALQGFYYSYSQIEKKEIVISEIKEMLEKVENKVIKNISLAQIYLIAGYPNKAIEVIQAFSQKEKKSSTNARLILADAYIQSNNFNDAIKVYSNLIEQPDSNLPFVINKYATAFDKAEKFQEGVKAFSYLKLKYPDQKQINIVLLNFYSELRQWNKVIEHIDALPSSLQKHVSFSGIKGKALYNMQDFTSALELLQTNYEQTNNSKIISLIFYSLIKLDMDQQAFNTISAHIEKYPNDVKNRTIFANTLVNYNREKALDEYRNIIKIDKRNIISLNNLAWYLYEDGKLDEALKLIKQAIEISPQNKGVLDTYNQIEKAIAENRI